MKIKVTPCGWGGSLFVQLVKDDNPKPTIEEVEKLAALWAADDRKWNTQEIVEQNLIAFAKALKP